MKYRDGMFSSCSRLILDFTEKNKGKIEPKDWAASTLSTQNLLYYKTGSAVPETNPTNPSYPYPE